jgi:hypothetical protein
MSDNDGEKPYRVGKGRPPKEHQWKKGQPSPNKKGRPKGSTRQTQLQKMLAKKIRVTDSSGRTVRKTVHEVIDHKLLEMAAKGDLKAIKLIKELLVIYERLGLVDQPSPAEQRRLAAEEEEKRKHVVKLTKMINDTMNLVQSFKRYDIVKFVNGAPRVADWVLEAAAERQPNSGFAQRFRLRKSKAQESSTGPVDKLVQKPDG